MSPLLSDRPLRIAIYLVFVTLIAVSSHLAYSWIGFNPTDNGYVLANSRRILEGQVPHRDYIAVRTELSSYLHAPEILLGGSHVFLFSRFVNWFQIALLSVYWPLIIAKMAKMNISLKDKLLYASIIFIYAINQEPVCPSSGMDALFLFSSGLLLLTGRSGSALYPGLFLMSLSVICKQNFLLILPVFLVILGLWRNPLNWVLLFSAPLLYGTWMLFSGAFGDMILQLSTPGRFAGSV